MRAKVYRLFVDGKQIPRWQLSQLVPVTGELQLLEFRDDLLNRHMRSAQLWTRTGR